METRFIICALSIITLFTICPWNSQAEENPIDVLIGTWNAVGVYMDKDVTLIIDSVKRNESQKGWLAKGKMGIVGGKLFRKLFNVSLNEDGEVYLEFEFSSKPAHLALKKDGTLRGLGKKSGIAGRDKVLVFIKNTQKEGVSEKPLSPTP